jgi:hypothetical protein
MARIACLLLWSCVVGACGNISRPGNDDFDAGQHDAAVIDTGVPDAVPPTASREIVGGAGRLTGGTYTLDVEIGHSFGQQPASGPTYTIEGNAAIKP